MKYTLTGFLKRDDADFGFLIPIYQKDNHLFFHKLSPDKKRIIEFTPYNKDEYEHDEIYVDLEKPNSNINRLLIEDSERIKQIDDKPTFVFKFKNLNLIGNEDNAKFVGQLALAIKLRLLKNEFLQEEIKQLFIGINAFDKKLSSRFRHKFVKRSEQAQNSHSTITPALTTARHR